ncbi:hypothetical protein [Motiliproteus sediminis]|uniref:hypothetical protein n=1 Tax=Motiliproteus sediminis TaxID=1468178 RepID=UPI001AEF4968|nr:hypothetical protein [Motiliproteus sediminis]
MSDNGRIRAALPEELKPESGDWAFVDLGFSSNSKSCGLLLGDRPATSLKFSELAAILCEEVRKYGPTLYLVLEAPLSVAFNKDGNPTGRSVEKRGSQHRYWYVGLGCSVLVAATYLLRSLVEAEPRRDVRLVEGLVSFKQKGQASNHEEDVEALKRVIWEPESEAGAIVPPDGLRQHPSHTLGSAFKVAGMDLGTPPVINCH